MSFDVTFTEIESGSGDIRKKITVGADGKVVKKPGASIYKGDAETKEICWDNFGGYLDGLGNKTDKAILLGVSDFKTAKIVTRRNWNDGDEKGGIITRSKDWFSFPNSGKIGLLYLDMDTEGWTVEELVDELSWLECSGWVKKSSSSVVDASGESILSGSYHIYLPVKNPTEFTIKNLAKHLWLEGMRAHLILKDGKVDWRTAIDKAVGSPERLIFEADPDLKGSGLKVARGVARRVVFGREGYIDGEWLDSYLKGLVSDTTFDLEWSDYLKQDEVKSESSARKREYNAELRKNLMAGGISLKKAKSIVSSRDRMILLASDNVVLNNGKSLKVYEILSDAEKWNGTDMRDPVEPDYGRNKAKVFVNEDNSVFVNSFAHGGRVFRLLWDYEGIWEWLKKVDGKSTVELDEVEELWAERCLQAELSSMQISKIVSRVFSLFKSNGKCSQNVVTKTDLKGELTDAKRERKKEVAEEVAVATGLEVDATHDDISEHLVRERFGGWDNFATYAGKAYAYEGMLWKGYDVKKLQKLIGSDYGLLSKCGRVSDYKSVAGYTLESGERMDAWPLVTGIPCKSGFWRVGEDLLNGNGASGWVKEDYGRGTFARWLISSDPSWDEATPLWNKIVNDAVSSDQRRLFQQMVGCIVTGLSVSAQKALLLQGAAGTGKSTILNVIKGLFPRGQVSGIALEDLSDDRRIPDLADSRLNVVPEVSSSKKIPTLGLKTLIGQDLLTAWILYQGLWSFEATCGLLVACNYFPILDEYSEQIRRRFCIVQFEGRIAEKDRVEDLSSKILSDEKSGVLAWVLDGAVDYLENGFDQGRNESLMSQWMTNVDTLSNFIKEECLLGKDFEVGAGVFYEKYVEFCETGRVKGLGKQKFRVRLETDFELKYLMTKHARGDKTRRVYRGIKFRI